MIAFLRSPAGKWTVRAVALVIGWLFVTRVLEITWPAGGDAFLIVLLIVMVASSAAFVVFVVDFIVLAVPQPPGANKSARPRFAGPIPPLSKAKQAQVRKLHKAMADAGVFAPEVPDPALAFAAFAVDKQPVDWVSVLQSLGEAPYYHPDCDPKSWSANLVFDHIPADWRHPPKGRVLACLWEDESIYLSYVAEDSLVALGKDIGRGVGWAPMDDETLGLLQQSRVFRR